MASDASEIFELFRFLDEFCNSDHSESVEANLPNINVSNFEDYYNKVKIGSVEDKLKCRKSTEEESFSFFQNYDICLPPVHETPLGQFVQRKTEEQIEDLSAYELKTLIDFALKEKKMLQIQNKIFINFLEKKDSKYSPAKDEFLKSVQIEDTDAEDLELTSREMIKSTIVFPEAPTTRRFMEIMEYFIKTVEQEITDLHRGYERDVTRFNRVMRRLNCEKKSYELNVEKVSETMNVLKAIMKKHKRGFTADPQDLKNFLQCVIKQDEEDLRRLTVLTYKAEKECKKLKRQLSENNPIHPVDIELLQIQMKNTKKKLEGAANEFLELKTILDTFQKQLDHCIEQKRLKSEELEIEKTKLKKALNTLGKARSSYDLAKKATK